jgi:hypothetical protein
MLELRELTIVYSFTFLSLVVLDLSCPLAFISNYLLQRCYDILSANSVSPEREREKYHRSHDVSLSLAFCCQLW